MQYIGMDLSSCADLTFLQIKTFDYEIFHIVIWFEMDKVFYQAGRQQGKTEEWAKQLRLAIKARPDNQIIVGCSNQRFMLDTLKAYFPDALFELMGTYGVRIHLRGG